MSNPLYGTPEAPKDADPQGVQDEQPAPVWGTPGAAKQPVVISGISWDKFKRNRPAQILTALASGALLFGGGALLAGSVSGEPSDDNRQCHLLPFSEVDRALGGSAGYDESRIDASRCVWHSGQARLTLSASWLTSMDAKWRDRQLAQDVKAVEDGRFEEVDGIGTYATWNPVAETLTWRTTEQIFYLEFDDLAPSADNPTRQKAVDLANVALRNQDAARAAIDD
ncbi:hypothetical protein [Kineosporia babensis]|uniref:DUF3558 domain-containing protein n=1 Tax=Kineosporia babensis TaxID=499548 RepID=A0A9X1NB01_9ACTN|nr:hypothetical protein [Kineosporia babensis]MCD5310486.1 hypothetical protein [Kineosporia babensis]